MDSEKFRVDFFTVEEIEEKYKNIIKDKKGQIFELNLKEKQNAFKKKISIIKEFKRIVKSNNYDIIHIHIDNSYNGIMYGIITKFISKNSKVIFHSHNAAITGKAKKILHNIFRPLLGFVGDEFATCSEKAAQWMFPKYIFKKKNIKFIENGIDIEKYIFNEDIRCKYREMLKLEDSFIIGHIGRFVTQKNHEFLIDIFYEIYKKDKKAKLVLIGIGELENKIKQKVENLKISNNVLFLGARKDVNNLLQVFDVFLLPSLYEGLPIVSVEAQASGLNTVLADSITKEAKINNNVKYISLNESAEFWANEILKFNVKYDRLECQQPIIESSFNIKKSVLNLQKFYLKILNKE